MIHYKGILMDTALCRDKTTISWITALYLSNARVDSISEFIKHRDEMVDELKQLQRVIQNVFLLNKRLDLM